MRYMNKRRVTAKCIEKKAGTNEMGRLRKSATRSSLKDDDHTFRFDQADASFIDQCKKTTCWPITKAGGYPLPLNTQAIVSQSNWTPILHEMPFRVYNNGRCFSYWLTKGIDRLISFPWKPSLSPPSLALNWRPFSPHRFLFSTSDVLLFMRMCKESRFYRPITKALVHRCILYLFSS